MIKKIINVLCIKKIKIRYVLFISEFRIKIMSRVRINVIIRGLGYDLKLVRGRFKIKIMDLDYDYDLGQVRVRVVIKVRVRVMVRRKVNKD